MVSNNTEKNEMDYLISEVAKKHKFILSEDDPVLVTVTINKLLLSNQIKESNRQIDELIKNASIQLNHSITKTLEGFITTIDKKNNEAIKKIEADKKNISFCRNLMILLSVITLSCAVTTWTLFAL